MEIAVILLSMALALAVAIAHSYKKERNEASLQALRAATDASNTYDLYLASKRYNEELELAKAEADEQVIDLENAIGSRNQIIDDTAVEITMLKQLAVNDREALKSALDESDLSNAEARKLAKKVQILQKALNEEQNMIIELENKIDSLKAKAKKAKAKKPVKKKK